MAGHQSLGGGGIFVIKLFFTEIQSYALYSPKDMKI